MGSGSSRLKEASPATMREPCENSVSGVRTTKPPRVLGDERFQFSLNASGIEPLHHVPVQAMAVLDLQSLSVASPKRSTAAALPPQSSWDSVPPRREVAPQVSPFSVEQSFNSETLLSDRQRQDTSLALAVHRSVQESTSVTPAVSGLSIGAFYHPGLQPPAQDAFGCSATVSTGLSPNHLRPREDAVNLDRSLISNSEVRGEAPVGWSPSVRQIEHGGEESPASGLQLATFTAASTNRGHMRFKI